MRGEEKLSVKGKKSHISGQKREEFLNRGLRRHCGIRGNLRT